MTELKGLKGRLPFRLGTTSYIIPDDVLPNVRWLAPRVDDVELVLFESDACSNLPSPEAVRELRAIAADQALTYTVHLPLDAALGDADPAGRRRSLETCLRLFDRMEALSPTASVVHFTGDRRGPSPSADLPRWLACHRESLRELLARVDARHLCVETLEYPFELVLPLVEELDLAVCLDIGHLLLDGRDVMSHLARLGDRIRIVHAHGIVDGNDHRSLGFCRPDLLAAVTRSLGETAERSERPVVMTMEVFSEPDFHDSMRAMEEVCRKCP